MIAVSVLLVACSVDAPLETAPGKYRVEHQRIRSADRQLHVTYVRPTEPRHPGCWLVFVTGDGGWRGVSSLLFRHLALEGYALAGFSGREITGPLRRSGERVVRTVAAERLARVFTQARRGLGVSDTVPLIVVGFSRGATIVAFAAMHPEVRAGIAGAVPIALTREADYLRAADEENRSPDIELDAKGRIQIYSALRLLGEKPVAVIQSSNDRYVSAAEARELLGPDTPARRLFAVEAKNHRFRGGRDELLAALDEALAWIECRPSERASRARVESDTPSDSGSRHREQSRCS
jgi:fermentation-respiration switch protein FrsA (DUF1100 family)